MSGSRADTNAPVLVTGATGFVGSHLVERLVADGDRVRCLVRRTSSLAWLPTGQVELVYGEAARNEGLREAVAGAGLVFHVARRDLEAHPAPSRTRRACSRTAAEGARRGPVLTW